MMVEGKTVQMYLGIFLVFSILFIYPTVPKDFVFFLAFFFSVGLFFYYTLREKMWPVNAIVFLRRMGPGGEYREQRTFSQNPDSEYHEVGMEQEHPQQKQFRDKRKDMFGLAVVIDQARRRVNKRDGSESYELRSLKKDLRPQDFGNIIETKKGLWSIHISRSPNDYQAMKIVDNELRAEDTDMTFWVSNAFKRIYMRWQKKKPILETMLPLIMVIMAGIMIVMIMYVSTEPLTSFASQIQSAANIVGDAVKQVQGASSSIPPIIPPG